MPPPPSPPPSPPSPPLPLYIADAFTSRAFAGNPAAVVLLPGGMDAPSRWMQAVAAEMNLSETAFVQPVEGGNAFDLRWFTPSDEVQLCGHATLAAAHLLWETGLADADQPIDFTTMNSGTLRCERATDGHIAMDFPADSPVPTDAPEGLVHALGLSSAAGVEAVLRGEYDWIVVLGYAAAVEGAVPDFAALGGFDCRGVCITAPGDLPHDVVSRFFAPRLRVAEDPVTGSIHCALGPYWAQRLGRQGSDAEPLRCLQTSRRRGELWVRVLSTRARVELCGDAVTVARGHLLHPPPLDP